MPVINGEVVRYETGSRCAFSDPDEKSHVHDDCPGEWEAGAPNVSRILCKCPCHEEDHDDAE